MEKTMKLTLSFMLVIVFVAAPKPASGMVLDTNGDILRPGIGYYIMPFLWGPLGGGLTIADPEKCPSDVVREPFDVQNGLPAKFFPWNSKVGFVPESTDLNVEFSLEASSCSTVWKLDERRYVTTGGVRGNWGADAINTWFKIEKAGPFFYKLVYCPTVCDSCKPICGDLGISVGEDGQSNLAISDRAHQVVFVKASDDKMHANAQIRLNNAVTF